MKVSIAVRALQRKEKYKVNSKLLRQIPGIGPLTTVQLLTEIENVKHFNSYIGLKPMVHSSGESDREGYMTFRHHQGLRSSLIECAWTTVQRDPVMLNRHGDLVKRHTGKRAIVISARKLLSRIYHVLKTDEPYQVGYSN